MRLVLFSDTHLCHRDVPLPSGDVLIHCGDFSNDGTLSEVSEFAAFFRAQYHRHKLVVAGNHNLCLERDPTLASSLFEGCHFLIDRGLELGGVRFWGAPWQPLHADWAFTLERGAALRAKWEQVPAGTHVLITHAPPLGILDAERNGEAHGAEELREAVRRLRPRLHVFGHIHAGYGTLEEDETLFVNASSCNSANAFAHSPIIVEIDLDLPPARSGRCQRCQPWLSGGSGNAEFPREVWSITHAFEHPVGGHGGDTGMTGRARCRACGGRAAFSCDYGPGYTFSSL